MRKYNMRPLINILLMGLDMSENSRPSLKNNGFVMV